MDIICSVAVQTANGLSVEGNTVIDGNGTPVIDSNDFQSGDILINIYTFSSLVVAHTMNGAQNLIYSFNEAQYFSPLLYAIPIGLPDDLLVSITTGPCDSIICCLKKPDSTYILTTISVLGTQTTSDPFSMEGDLVLIMATTSMISTYTTQNLFYSFNPFDCAPITNALSVGTAGDTLVTTASFPNGDVGLLIRSNNLYTIYILSPQQIVQAFPIVFSHTDIPFGMYMFESTIFIQTTGSAQNYLYGINAQTGLPLPEFEGGFALGTPGQFFVNLLSCNTYLVNFLRDVNFDFYAIVLAANNTSTAEYAFAAGDSPSQILCCGETLGIETYNPNTHIRSLYISESPLTSNLTGPIPINNVTCCGENMVVLTPPPYEIHPITGIDFTLFPVSSNIQPGDTPQQMTCCTSTIAIQTISAAQQNKIYIMHASESLPPVNVGVPTNTVNQIVCDNELLLTLIQENATQFSLNALNLTTGVAVPLTPQILEQLNLFTAFQCCTLSTLKVAIQIILSVVPSSDHGTIARLVYNLCPVLTAGELAAILFALGVPCETIVQIVGAISHTAEFLTSLMQELIVVDCYTTVTQITNALFTLSYMTCDLAAQVVINLSMNPENNLGTGQALANSMAISLKPYCDCIAIMSALSKAGGSTFNINMLIVAMVTINCSVDIITEGLNLIRGNILLPVNGINWNANSKAFTCTTTHCNIDESYILLLENNNGVVPFEIFAFTANGQIDPILCPNNEPIASIIENPAIINTPLDTLQIFCEDRNIIIMTPSGQYSVLVLTPDNSSSHVHEIIHSNIPPCVDGVIVGSIMCGTTVYYVAQNETFNVVGSSAHFGNACDTFVKMFCFGTDLFVELSSEQLYVFDTTTTPITQKFTPFKKTHIEDQLVFASSASAQNYLVIMNNNPAPQTYAFYQSVEKLFVCTSLCQPHTIMSINRDQTGQLWLYAFNSAGSPYPNFGFAIGHKDDQIIDVICCQEDLTTNDAVVSITLKSPASNVFTLLYFNAKGESITPIKCEEACLPNKGNFEPKNDYYSFLAQNPKAALCEHAYTLTCNGETVVIEKDERDQYYAFISNHPALLLGSSGDQLINTICCDLDLNGSSEILVTMKIGSTNEYLYLWIHQHFTTVTTLCPIAISDNVAIVSTGNNLAVITTTHAIPLPCTKDLTVKQSVPCHTTLMLRLSDDKTYFINLISGRILQIFSETDVKNILCFNDIFLVVEHTNSLKAFTDEGQNIPVDIIDMQYVNDKQIFIFTLENITYLIALNDKGELLPHGQIIINGSIKNIVSCNDSIFVVTQLSLSTVEGTSVIEFGVYSYNTVTYQTEKAFTILPGNSILNSWCSEEQIFVMVQPQLLTTFGINTNLSIQTFTLTQVDCTLENNLVFYYLNQGAFYFLSVTPEYAPVFGPIAIYASLINETFCRCNKLIIIAKSCSGPRKVYLINVDGTICIDGVPLGRDESLSRRLITRWACCL